jgi:hypothetical protein
VACEIFLNLPCEIFLKPSVGAGIVVDHEGSVGFLRKIEQIPKKPASDVSDRSADTLVVTLHVDYSSHG